MKTKAKRKDAAKPLAAVRKRPVAARPKARPGRGEASILASVHETMSGLHRAGVVTATTMRDFDELCLPPVPSLGGKQIAALRKREKVSQPVFAKYLNVSKSSVSQWEAGAKNPDAAALKLLDLVKRKGLAILA